MSDWYVVGRDSDPAPGDPAGIRGLASRLLGEADLADRNTGRLRTIAAGDGELQMEGDYASKFRDMLGELPGELSKLGRAYRKCGESVRAYADDLEGAKSRAGAALRNGRDAEDRFQGALRQVRSLLPADRQTQVSSGLSLSEFSVESITTGLDENLRAQVRSAAARGRAADADRGAARRLADEAAKLRGDAEHKAEKGIHDALDSGIKNKSWWEKAWDFVSAPFRSWDAFVDLCKTIAMVAGVVALFISGPIGLALVAIALVASAVVFASDLNKFAKGEVGLGTLALDALGLIPGARGVVSVTKLGRAAVSLGEAFGRGEGGKLLLGGLRTFGGDLLARGKNVVSAFPRVLTDAKSIAGNALKNPMQFARDLNARALGRDPIDLGTGEMVMFGTDFTLPGILPLALERTYVSGSTTEGWFGPSWSSVLDQRLEIDQHGIWYAGPGGVQLGYPHLQPGQTVLPERGAALPLTLTRDGRYLISDHRNDLTLHFAVGGDGVLGVVLPLATIADRNGNRIDLGYDANTGVLREVRHSGGYDLDVETERGLVTAFSLRGRGEDEPDLELVRYGYDVAGRLVRVVNSSGQPLSFRHDEAGRIVEWLDRNGTWYRYAYDARGRVTATSGSAGCLDGTIRYDESRRVTVEVDSLGNATTYQLNEHSQVVRIVDALGHETTRAWDLRHRKVAETDPLGRTTSWRYDQAGDLVEVRRPDGSATAIHYDASHRPVTVTNPDGSVWQCRYDGRGNAVEATDPTGAVTRFGHDERGRLTRVTDALGATRTLQCDVAGLPVRVTDPLGATTLIRRDRLGRETEIEDALGARSTLTWSIEGRLLAVTDPDGATRRWVYDGEGNCLEYTDQLGQATRSQYTHFGLPIARPAPGGGRLALSYDTELRLVAVARPDGTAWRYRYDAVGRLAEETDFDGRRTAYRYDAAGQLLERVNAAGQTVSHQWDALGNVVAKQVGDVRTSLQYDANGLVVRAGNGDAQLVLERDPLGRVLRETVNGRTVQSRYDGLGRRVERTTPSGADSRWEYDAAGRPVALSGGGRSMRFGFDPVGREVQRVFDGGSVTQTWDVASHLVSQSLIPQQQGAVQRSYRHRADGYLTARSTGGGRQTWQLDPAGRVTAVEAPGGPERYRYDPLGNLVEATWPATGDDAAATGEREYQGSLLRRAGRMHVDHDAQGRLIRRLLRLPSGGTRQWRYAWDAEDRLTAVQTPEGHTWLYRYDPLGRRIAKQRLSPDRTTVAEQVDFAWDGVLLAEQLSAGRALSWDVQPGDVRPVTQRARVSGSPDEAWVDAQFHAIVTDLLGTPTELIDPDGQVLPQARSLWGAGGPADTPLRFPGQYADDESGLHYNVLRHYDPLTGAYVSPDPLGLLAGSDGRRYVLNPMAWLDLLGLAVSWCSASQRWRDTTNGQYVPRPGDPSALLNNGSMAHSDLQAWVNSSAASPANNWTPAANFPNGGFNYDFVEDGTRYRVWGHGSNPNAPVGSNAANGPTVRVHATNPTGVGTNPTGHLTGTGGYVNSGPANFPIIHIPLTGSPY